jgi:hypothetical protein
MLARLWLFLAMHPWAAYLAMSLLGTTIGIAVILFIGVVFEGSAFRKRGHRVRVARDGQTCRYEEYVVGGRWIRPSARHIRLPTIGTRLNEQLVPSDAVWDQRMPAWARGRRSDILARVAAALGVSPLRRRKTLQQDRGADSADEAEGVS